MKEFVCMLKEKWKSSEMYTGSIFIAMREDGSYFVSEGDALDVVYTMYRLICHPDYKTYKEQLAFLDEVAPAAQELTYYEEAKDCVIVAEYYDYILTVNRPGTHSQFASVYSNAINEIADKYDVTVDSIIKQLKYYVCDEAKERGEYQD